MAGILQKGARRFTTQIGAAGVPDAVTTTIPLVSVTGLPTDTQIELVIDRTDASGNLTPAKEEVVRGTVSGTSLINCIRGVEGTAQAHSAGATVNSFLTASMWNNIIEYTRDLPTRGLINGLIVPTVASNNLTVAIKTLQNTDPSPSNPVYVWIGNTLRSITGALSTTFNAGFNGFNSGSSELATKEIDYFVYIGRLTAGGGLELGFARIPYARLASDFVNSGGDEKYARFGAATSLVDFTEVVNIGRFAATLSASPSFNWSVPSFNNANLIQEPIYETRWLTWKPTYGATGSMTYTTVTEEIARYMVSQKSLSITLRSFGTTGGSASNALDASLPFSFTAPMNGQFSVPRLFDGASLAGIISDHTNNVIRFSRYDNANFGLGANRYIMATGTVELN